MAERLKTKILDTDKMVDLVAGPGKDERERETSPSGDEQERGQG